MSHMPITQKQREQAADRNQKRVDPVVDRAQDRCNDQGDEELDRVGRQACAQYGQ